MKKWRWYIKFPSDFYALGPVDFRHLKKPPTSRDVREWARNWAGISRLPKGFECWPE